MKPNHLGFLALLGTSFIYGIFGILVRALTPYMSASLMTLGRSLIVCLIIGLFLVVKKKTLFHVPHKLFVPLFVHSVTFGITLFLFTYAVILTSLSKATFSFYSTTLLTSLIASVFIFKEGFSSRKKVSFVFAVLGLLFFIFPTGIGTIDLGMTLTGIAGINDVLTNSMKKYLGGRVERLVLVFYQMLAGVLISTVIVFFFNEFTLIKSLDLSGIVWLLFFSLNFFLLSYLTAYGFQHFDLNLGTIILSMEFVFASLVGFFVFKETLTIYQIMACFFLVGSIIAMNMPQTPKKQELAHQ